jgi:hypothetical protein
MRKSFEPKRESKLLPQKCSLPTVVPLPLPILQHVARQLLPAGLESSAAGPAPSQKGGEREQGSSPPPTWSSRRPGGRGRRQPLGLRQGEKGEAEQRRRRCQGERGASSAARSRFFCHRASSVAASSYAPDAAMSHASSAAARSGPRVGRGRFLPGGSAPGWRPPLAERRG